MLSFLRTVLAVFVGLFVFLVFVVAGLAALVPAGQNAAQLPDDIVLYVDLRTQFVDGPVEDPFFLAGGGASSIVNLVQALARAEDDPRVSGVYLRAGGVPLPMSQAQEIHEALTAFKAQDKFVIAHAQGFFGTGLGTYHAASAADEIWMQPNGLVNTSGLALESLFFTGLLDKLGITPDLEQFYEYKGAADALTETAYTEAQRQTLGRLLQSAYEQSVGTIAASRNLSGDVLVGRMANAPLLGKEALDAQFVDRLGYDDDAEFAALDRAGLFSEILDWRDYFAVAGSPYTEGPSVALIYGEGAIHEGESDFSQFGSGATSMGGDTLSRALREAADDADVQAILFRVNSPGGSVIASDQIWDAVNYAKEAGKPVVISMGDVAASGGYYVSMSADKIIANPTTITGSIGVVSGKFVVSEALANLGITTDRIVVGT
ncbi:MAG: S49 family peptidase, partial [Pseudomonadota bacterium]